LSSEEGLDRSSQFPNSPDLLAHTMSSVLVVASMVAAIALLQAEGRFTYIAVQPMTV
jgi:hypothetical protein